MKIKRNLITLQFHQQYITLSISKATAILQTLSLVSIYIQIMKMNIPGIKYIQHIFN